MKLTLALHRHLRWLNLPGALLVTLLQRTPALRLAATAGEFVLASPIGHVLRSAAAVAASLGALHSLAGATALVTNKPSPLSTTVGTSVGNVVFTVSGTQSAPASWRIGGSIPPGLSFSGRATAGSVNISTLVLTGAPTTAGSFQVTLQAFEGTNLTQNQSPVFAYTINAAAAVATAPAFTTQPTSQTVTAGASVTFAAVASGAPAPALQWTKNGSAISGATGATLTLPNVQAADAGSYAVVATNASGSATSSSATLTVNAAVAAPSFTTQPASQTATAGASVTFTAAASGAPAPTLQWTKNGSPISGVTGATLTLSNVQPADAGSYAVVATNAGGSATSSSASLTVSAVVPGLSFTAQPAAQTIASGSTVVFTAAATGSPAYQWQRNNAPISGATDATLVISHATAADAGGYTCVATNFTGRAVSSLATLTVNSLAIPDVGHLINVSILTTAGAGAKVLTVGAVIGPSNLSSSLPLVVRAVGPTLGTAFGLLGVLADPVVTVNATSPAAVLATNDNWGGGPGMTAAFASVGAFALPAASLDSAFVALSPGLAPGGYTVQVGGKGDATGLVIAEIYDAGDATRTATTPRLINLSTLTQIDTGASLTAGFVLRGQSARTVLVRGVGPSLAQLGVGGVMTDPKLELFNNDTGQKIGENDDWGGGAQLANVTASVGAFALAGVATKDAVILVTLSPGAYSARVSDVNGAGGTAIVEVYEVP